ncbi:hypothetical protein C5F44_11585 [Fuscovulum blasticum DSM 2131]|uniref:Uncharacterized protein n=1 Tax=Fuscovulum blasticum DSM 2131 TaxID=1188250 RepID=A0A2T4J7T1_FUSBL|nr:hypothetical protein C5F44_11585 [Fuscovulum blasticum DSM 2131]
MWLGPDGRAFVFRKRLTSDRWPALRGRFALCGGLAPGELPQKEIDEQQDQRQEREDQPV